MTPSLIGSFLVLAAACGLGAAVAWEWRGDLAAEELRDFAQAAHVTDEVVLAWVQRQAAARRAGRWSRVQRWGQMVPAVLGRLWARWHGERW